MYEHYKPAQEIFVDREEYLSWMDNALERCREKSVILHLRGIGGIGKSTLLNHWTRTIDSTVRLDCQQYTEFYSRLDILAKGAVRVGVDLKRFDILWHIRKRFVEGVEPATEKGRDWAKEVLVAIPFIGSLASIGSAIKSVGDTVAPKLKKRYGDVGRWLQDRLGTQYLERLLEILWKEPEHAEFLFLDALLEDINHRKNMDTPLLFLFDHSENVDCENMRWHYSGRRITEMELWYVFVSSLKNCIGVVASRRAAPPLSDKKLKIEEKELLELDRNSSKDLLGQRGVDDANFQDKIISISAGNPFVINAICDMIEVEEVAVGDLEDLRANTLDEVRLKTWRRLFSYTKDLLNLVDRAGLLPAFHKELMGIVAPDMKTDQWERLIRLSFVKPRSNGTFVLHDLARDLVRAELGNRMEPAIREVSRLLMEASEKDANPALIGYALSVKALESEEDAIAEAKTIITDLIEKGFFTNALKIVDNLFFQTYVGDIEILGLRGIVCSELHRYSEAEFSLNAAINSLEELDPELGKTSIAIYLYYLGVTLHQTGRFTEAEQPFLKSLKILRAAAESKSPLDLYHLNCCLRSLSYYYYRAQRASEGFDYAMEALKIARDLNHPFLLPLSLNMAAIMLGNAGRFEEQKELYQEAISFYRKSMEKTSVSPFEKALLAALLNNISLSMQDTDEIEEIHREIFQLRAEIAEYFPAGLAFAKAVYASFCLGNFRLKDAEKFINEALAFYAEGKESDQQQWKLYVDICNLLLAEVYVLDDKLSSARELIDNLYPTNLTDLDSKSSTFLFSTLWKLTLSGFHFYMARKYSEAMEDFRLCTDIIDKMTIDTAEEIQVVSWCLATYALLCEAVGKYEDAKYAWKRAKEIFSIYGMAWWTNLGIAIYEGSLGRILLSESKFTEAEKTVKEAIKKMEAFIKPRPESILPRMAKLLNNLSIILSKQGRYEEALEVLRESINVKKEIVKNELNLFRASLAVSLNNEGVLLSRFGKQVEAKEKLMKSLNIRRQLFKQIPEKYAHDLASSLQNMAIITFKEDSMAESRKHYEEAYRLQKRIGAAIPEMPLDLLKLDFETAMKKEIWSVETEPIYVVF